MNPIGLVVICLLVAIPVGAGGAEAVLRADGSLLPGAVVSCMENDCWVVSPFRAPIRVQRSLRDPIEAPEAPGTRLLVLTDQGEAVSDGFIRWLVDGLPADLRELAWQAEGGRLDLAGQPGVAAEVVVDGFAPALIHLEPGAARTSVVLQPIQDVTLKIQPASAGVLLLATKSDLHLLSLFGSVAQRWEIPESGELLLEGLSGNQPMLGVVFAPGWAPVAGPLPEGRSTITIALAEGLSVAGTVHDEDGQPVAGAEVAGAGVIEELDRWRYTQRAVTDAEGKFVLTGFLEGPVVVRAWKQGFAEATQNVDLGQAPAEPIAFTLVPGVDLKVLVVDLENRPLPDISVVLGKTSELTDSAGRVEFRGWKRGETAELELSGDVIIPETRTVEVNGETKRIAVARGGGISWPLYLAEDVAEDGVVVRWGRLNDEGREIVTGFGVWEAEQLLVAVNGLQAGTYVISVRIPDFEKLSSDPVEVELGELVTLPPASPDVGMAVMGRVVDAESGGEIAGALIKVEEGSPSAFREPSEVLTPRTARSDADGSFRIGGLAETEHRVRVEAPGKAPAVVEGVTPEEGGTDLGTIELGDGLTIEGLVVDRQRRPVPSAAVTIREPHPYAYFPETEMVTDREGSFRIERLTPGEWKIEVEAGAARASELVDGGNDETVEVELTMGGVELEIQILRGGLPAPAGRVSLSLGGSSSGMVVLVDRGPDSRKYFGAPGDRHEAAVDADGMAVLSGVDAETYTLGYRSNDGRYSGSTELAVPDVPRHSAIVRLPSGSVEGVVVDPDERPVAGADVRFFPSSGTSPRSAYSVGDGAFRIDGLPAGPGEVVAAHDSFEPSPSAEIEVVDDVPVGPVILRLGSQRESGLKVRIVATSAGSSGAPVTVTGPDSRLEFTDPSGIATFAGLPEGIYRVCGRIFGGTAGCLDRTAEVPESGVAEVDLGLADGGWVEVVSSSPLNRGRFQVLTETGADLSWALFLGNPPGIDGDTAVFGPILPGRYQVSCTSCTGRSSGTVDVTAGETAVLDLR